MSAEVRSLLETEISALLSSVVDCPVLPGRALNNAERPDHYVTVVAEDGDERGGAVFLVPVDIKIVVPLDEDGSRLLSNQRHRRISDWLYDDACPLRGFTNDRLKVHGFNLEGFSDEDGSRSYAEIISLVCGAMAL